MKYQLSLRMIGEFPGSPDIDTWEIDEEMYNSIYKLFVDCQGFERKSGPISTVKP